MLLMHSVFSNFFSIFFAFFILFLTFPVPFSLNFFGLHSLRTVWGHDTWVRLKARFGQVGVGLVVL